MHVNYISECETFIRHARDHCLSGNEQLLWRALFTICNEHAGRAGGSWPEEYIRITNKELLSWLPFSENTLTSVRAEMVKKYDQPLFDYIRGVKNTDAPQYRMRYLTACPKSGGNMEGNVEGKPEGSTRDISKTKPNNKKPIERKKTHFNNGYRYSVRAARATAQNILDELPELAPDGTTDALEVLCDYFALGMTPEQIVIALADCRSMTYLPAHLHTYAVHIGLEQDD